MRNVVISFEMNSMEKTSTFFRKHRFGTITNSKKGKLPKKFLLERNRRQMRFRFFKFALYKKISVFKLSSLIY